MRSCANLKRGINVNLEEVISLIKRNGNDKREAIVLLSDFLAISKKEAKEIYKKEFEI